MTLNLPLLYVLWWEEYWQTSPNKNQSPNLWHVTSISVCCIFDSMYLGPKMETLLFIWISSKSFRHYWDKVILVNKHLPFLVVSFFTLWLFFWRDEATFISTLMRFIYSFFSSVFISDTFKPYLSIQLNLSIKLI